MKSSNSKLRFVNILFVLFMFYSYFTSTSLVQATGYYSSPAGVGNGCTLSTPCTLNTGISKLIAGDTLNLLGGTYLNSRIYLTASGSQTNPIIIQGYLSEKAILDGQGIFPNGSGSYMVQIYGNWVTLRNLTIESSGKGGVYSGGTNVVVENLDIIHAQDAAITLTGDYDLAQNNRAENCGLMNENNKSGTTGGWPAIITCARYPQHCTLRKNTVAHSWGEGISTFESIYTTIEDNVSYDNQQNFYLSDTKYSVFQRNLSYCTSGNVIDPYMTQNALLVGDEKGVPDPFPNGTVRISSSDNKILNNFMMGCDRNLAAGTMVSTNNLYAYNTFVNSDVESGERANVLIYVAGTCTNCRFINNLVLQESSTPISIGGGLNNGWNFSNNLWSKNPGSNFTNTGSNDIIDIFTLAKTGLTGPGQLTADWFKLLPDAPAINKAMVLSEVAEDYFKNTRGQFPDIGAHEYTGSIIPSPTSFVSPTPIQATNPIQATRTPTTIPGCVRKTQGDADCNGTIDLVDFEMWRRDYTGEATTRNADFNNDTRVDLVDFEIWRRSYAG